MATTATVKWMDGMAMVAESGSGHGFIMDGAPANGGRKCWRTADGSGVDGTGWLYHL